MKKSKLRKLDKLRNAWKDSALIFGVDSIQAQHYERLIVKLWRKHGTRNTL